MVFFNFTRYSHNFDQNNRLQISTSDIQSIFNPMSNNNLTMQNVCHWRSSKGKIWIHHVALRSLSHLDRVQIRGRSCAGHSDMYKTQCIRSATTNRLHGSHFCNYKMQSTIWFEIENNSRYALQKTTHLKLKNNWNSEMLTWIFPIYNIL